jgi:hypothetical protein
LDLMLAMVYCVGRFVLRDQGDTNDDIGHNS